jgi:hypothetical protein
VGRSKSVPFYTLEDYKPPLAVQSSMETLPINELKRTQRVRIYTIAHLNRPILGDLSVEWQRYHAHLKCAKV